MLTLYIKLYICIYVTVCIYVYVGSMYGTRLQKKKLLQQKEATELAINVLCDLSKKHCSSCEWEQEFSDNPLLFDPVFARRYIAERKSWLVNKQSMCARCKFQFGEHLIDQNAQNTANLISAADNSLQNLI